MDPESSLSTFDGTREKLVGKAIDSPYLLKRLYKELLVSILDDKEMVRKHSHVEDYHSPERDRTEATHALLIQFMAFLGLSIVLLIR